MFSLSKHYTYLFLLVAVVGIFSSHSALMAETKTWTGTSIANNHWQNGANWEPNGIPTVFDDVVIPNVGKPCIINHSNFPANYPNTVQAKSVLIESGAELEIEPSSSLSILNSSVETGNGITNSGTISNFGTIGIGASGAIPGTGIINSGTITNHVTGFIHVIQTTGNGIFNTGNFVNHANLIIGNSPAGIGGEGLENRGAFLNQVTATISISAITKDAISNALGTFDNYGAIVIGEGISVENGINNKDTFTNHHQAEISIDRTNKNGIVNTSTLNNSGTIEIGENEIIGEEGIHNEGIFNNLADGVINIYETTGNCIGNVGAANFTNDNLIKIGFSTQINANGIYNSRRFTNNATGEIDINNLTFNGIVNQPNDSQPFVSDFSNSGKIQIGKDSAIDGNGIINDRISIAKTAIFRNESDGEIILDRIGGHGIANRDGNFINSATIDIGNTASIGDAGIANFKGFFRNDLDGHITINRVTSAAIYSTSLFVGSLDFSFLNNAQITIGNAQTGGQVGIRNLGNFKNDSSGEITIDRMTLTAIANTGVFENTNKIDVGASANIVADGILNERTFKNLGDGEINIHQVTRIGVLNNSEDAVFTNAAALNVGVDGSIDLLGIMVQQEATLDNQTTGVIRIDNVSGDALATDGTGIITNAGSIFIGADLLGAKKKTGAKMSATIGGKGISLEGSFTNTGVVSVASSVEAGIFISSNDATFTNESGAELIVEQGIENQGIFNNQGTTETDIIVIFDNGTFTNDSEANLTIDTSIKNEGTVNNQGTIEANIVVNDATFTNESEAELIIVEKIENQGSVDNQGAINVDEFILTYNDIENTGTLDNQGTIEINVLAIYDDATFTSKLAGKSATKKKNSNITVNNQGTIEANLIVISNDATFTNESEAELIVEQGIANNGILNNQGTMQADLIAIHEDATFDNRPEGELFIANIIENEGTLNNGGTIESELIIVFEDATFTNESEAELIVEQEIEIIGTFDNQGTVETEIIIIQNPEKKMANTSTFNNQGMVETNMLVVSNNTIFTNKPEGEVVMEGKIENAGTINNQGIIRSNFDGTHLNTGAFTNTGTIEDLQNSFGGIPIDNQDIIVAPINSCGSNVFSDALQIGTNNDFTISDKWYSEETLTNALGDYDQSNNVFTLTALEGSYQMYMQVINTSTNPQVTRIIAIDVTGGVPILPSVETICEGENLQLIGSTVEGTAWSWTGPNEFTSNEADPIIFNASAEATGTYHLTVTGGECTIMTSVSATVNATPIPSISGDLEYCASDTNTTLDAGNWTSYLWSNNATTQTIAATEGTYTVTITNDKGCSGTANATVNELNATPVPDIATLPNLTGQCEVNVTDIPTATDECGITVSGTTSDPVAYTSQGTYTITWRYDNGYQMVTQTQTIIVADTEFPTIHDCPSDAEYCGAQTVEWTAPTVTDNCSATLTSSHNSGDFFEVGVTTVTYTALDTGGNTVVCSFDIEVYALPNVSISESELDEFCQGTAALTANVSNPVADLTYAWTGGLTPTETATAFSNDTYDVTVTDGNGCKGSDSYVLNVATGSQLSQYVILSGDDIDFKYQSMVHSGGVGSTDNKGKIKVEKQSVVHTFAMADKVEIKSGSFVTNSIQSPSMVSLPAFQYNTFNGNTDFTVSDGQTATITGSHYDKIEVKKNATLYIDASVLYAKEIKTKEGAMIHFLQPTEIMLKKGLDLDKDNTFNASGEQVVVYAEKQIQVSENSNVTGVLYTLDHLHVKGKSSESVSMTGMFLAEKKVKSDKYVNWNWSTTCGTLTAPIASTGIFKQQVTETPIVNISMNLYPNPASDRVTLQLEGVTSATPIELTIYSPIGQIVWSAQVEEGQNTLQLDLAAIGLNPGMYLVNAIAGEKQMTRRLVVE